MAIYDILCEVKDVREADTGICELSMGSILLGQAKTARDGVELLGEIVEKCGFGGM